MKTKTAELCRTALCTALICVSAYIVIPLPFTAVMITAQTFAVNLAALLLRPKYAAAALIAYVLIGITGLPVFSGGTGGIARLAGPTGGYIIGYIFAAFLISLAAGDRNSFKRNLIATICVGIPIIYIFGASFTAFHTGNGFKAILAAYVLPFIPGDIAKCIAASFVGVKLKKALDKTHVL